MAGLLFFNFIFSRFLKQSATSLWLACCSVAANSVLIAFAVKYSGGQASYLWAMYLLPIFTACILFTGWRVWLFVFYVIFLHWGFYWKDFRGMGTTGWFQLLTQTAVLLVSASIVARLTHAEKRAKLAAMLQRENLERALLETEIAASVAAGRPPENMETAQLRKGLHDMGNALTVITGTVDLIKGENKNCLSQDMKRIETAVLRCNAILSDIRASAKNT